MDAPAPPPVIDVRDIHKRFGDKAVVVGVTLQVAQGEIFGFLGPNGISWCSPASMPVSAM